MKSREEKPLIVKRVSVIDTIRLIGPGESVTYRASELASISSVHAVASRLNDQAGRKEYTVSTTDNGETYTVTRIDFKTGK